MGYFSRFPFVKDYLIDGQAYTGMDITRRTGIVDRESLPASVYMEYTIRDGESPIVLADRLYDDPEMYWVIMLFNGIFDIEDEWPLDQVALDNYVTRIYDDPYGIHHYISVANGLIVDPEVNPDYDTIPVTNYEHEIALNDAKRDIKLPTPSYASSIVSQHNKLVKA